MRSAPGGLGWGLGRTPRSRTPGDGLGRGGKGWARAQGWLASRHKGVNPAGWGSTETCPCAFYPGGLGGAEVLGSRVRWSGQLSAEVGLQHSGGGAGDKDDMGSG